MRRVARLTKEEKEIEKTIGGGEWRNASKPEIDRHVGMARSFVKSARKEGRINIRIADRDIALIKEMANSEGLPYQTFMASILHKYVNGLLVDHKLVSELKKMIAPQKPGRRVKAS